jgi:LacI family transcriptional regulator
VVLLNRAPGVAAASVMVDNYGGAHAMTQHLLSLGHRRIGFLAGAANNADSDERERGFQDALRAAKVSHECELCVRGDFAEEGGWRGARALLSLATPPSVIFAANDAMAVGALSALREAGVDVPGQIGVVGFDDIPVARFLHPPLTSVRVGIATLGERGAELLLQALAERSPPGTPPRSVVLPTELVVRGSCGARASTDPLSLPTGALAERSTTTSA